jgi:predicted AlkP superfamily pyrophosphatase or phosphodiesterase
MKKLYHLALIAAFAMPAASAIAQERPRLVVVISIDQFRGDYVERFSEHYLPATSSKGVGGFKWLLKEGANYYNAHHAHVPTATGPGHAAILTGTGPQVHGIAGNQWYDRVGGKVAYCVADPSAKTLGGASGPMSARNLKSTTVGDELKMATSGKAKVVGIAFKDRAAILMAGHAADTVIWFDPRSGWVSSDYFSPSLPAWVEALNAQKLPLADMDKSWTPLLEDSAYAFSRVMPGQAQRKPVFSHPVKDDWIGSSYGQEFLFRSVKLAVENESLGRDEIPDILAINLSSNDYVGHTYGPNSPEVFDISVRTDRLLSDFFNYLNKTVPGGLKNITFALTGDHGVVPIVEEAAQTYRLPAVRNKPAELVAAVNAALDAKHGAGKWVAAITEGNLYLNRPLVAEKGLDLNMLQDQAAEAAAAHAGVQFAIAGHRIMEGRVPAWDWFKVVSRSYNPKLSGDVVVTTMPGNYEGSLGTGHFSPWVYDTHVPVILAGFGIKPGSFGRKAEVPMIAPTLSHLLGIEFPSGSTTELLWEALKS